MIRIRRKDITILTVVALFLGIFIAIQYSLIKPSRGNTESSETMAVEIEHLAKKNADLKNQVNSLTKKNQAYNDSLNDQAALDEQISMESQELVVINAESTISGQGVEIGISGKLVEAQIVDLINAIKNIGADAIAFNGVRVNLYSSFNHLDLAPPYTIAIVGNSTMLESALNRKGGIIELLREKEIEVSLTKRDNLSFAAAEQNQFKYARIREN